MAYIINDTSEDGITLEQARALLAQKQDILVSGENIKTINSSSVLGSGDLTIRPTE